MSEWCEPQWRVEEIGGGFAVQYLSRGEFRSDDMWVSIGHYDAVNKCVVFGREQAAAISAALLAIDKPVRR